MDQADYIDEIVYFDCKSTLLEHVSSKKTEQKDELLEELASMDSGTRSLVQAMANKKYQEKYKSLNESQKNLLKEYINNISTSDNLRQYCNKQVTIIKGEMGKMVESITDEVRRIKLMEITKSLAEVPATKTVSDSDVNNLLYYFELIKEHKELNVNTK